MKTRFLRGNTAENNGLTLANGELAIDLEKKAVRLHDGTTPGGFELLGTRAYEPVGAGPADLIAGDSSEGFYGEVASTDFIDGATLSLETGFSQGTTINNDAGWLKFALDGKILFVAKKPIKHSFSWQTLVNLDMVYGDELDKSIVIGEFTYRVRLFKGTNENPYDAPVNTYSPIETELSEWNRLMYPIHSGVHTETAETLPPGEWASYSDDELGLHQDFSDGSLTMCQEQLISNSYAITRGYLGITYLAHIPTSGAHVARGWRPVLELVQ